jgi:hypothetical protein
MPARIKFCYLSRALCASILLLGSDTAWSASVAGSACDENILDIGSAAALSAQAKADIGRTERWENARAIYERDLDYQHVEAQQYLRDYTPKRDLVEAKYRLALAEGKLIVPNYDKQAILDLKQAQSFLAQALKGVGPEDANQGKLQAVNDRVARIWQFVAAGQCWSKRLTEAFDDIDQNIEQLLQRL